jgi:hypothetical protein
MLCFVVRVRGNKSLPDIILALQSPRRLTCGLSRGDHYGDQNRDDEYCHEDFDERDASSYHRRYTVSIKR